MADTINDDKEPINELDLQYFFFKLPIYKPIQLTKENWDGFLEILNLGRGQRETSIEGYNPFRGLDSTFGGWSNIKESIEYFTKYGGTDRIGIKCKRYGEVLDFFIHYDADKHILMKVGQYPSVADFHIYELKRYDKVLSKEKLKEISRAIGLAANGIGIGSFVYLRRIFEHLIWTTFNEQKAAINIVDKDFAAMKMDVKIQTIKDYLPNFLVENKSLYSILSLGIHKLTEEECLAYFTTVRHSIEVILDEKLEAKKQEERKILGAKNISDLHTILKTKNKSADT